MACQPTRVRRGTPQCCTHDHVMPQHQHQHHRTNGSPKVEEVAYLAGSAQASLATALISPRRGRQPQKLGGRWRGEAGWLSHFGWSLWLASLHIELILTSVRQNTKTSFQSIDSHTFQINDWYEGQNNIRQIWEHVLKMLHCKLHLQCCPPLQCQSNSLGCHCWVVN